MPPSHTINGIDGLSAELAKATDDSFIVAIRFPNDVNIWRGPLTKQKTEQTLQLFNQKGNFIAIFPLLVSGLME